MNKEVEEAKAYFEELIKGYEQNLKEIEDFDEYEEEQKFIKRRVSKLKILLNYIQELEEENEELHKEINKRIKLKIENEHIVDREFIYKPKIRDRIEELKQLLVDPQCAENVRYRIYELQKLLNEEE